MHKRNCWSHGVLNVHILLKVCLIFSINNSNSSVVLLFPKKVNAKISKFQLIESTKRSIFNRNRIQPITNFPITSIFLNFNRHFDFLIFWLFNFVSLIGPFYFKLPTQIQNIHYTYFGQSKWQKKAQARGYRRHWNIYSFDSKVF